MTQTIFLATLGQRPEAITMALDVLHPRYHYAEIGILHTHSTQSGIAEAYQQLMPRLASDYGQVTVQSYELQDSTGYGLKDITNQHSAELYHRGVLEILRQYRLRYVPVHLLVAGGRKAMSIYATLAASLLFGEHDRVWTILSDESVMMAGLFHTPVGQADAVQVVELPLLLSRLLPGMMTDLDALLKRQSPREQFLKALAKEEMRLGEVLKQHPYASNEELGNILGKSDRTIENQLRAMYQKLPIYFDLELEDKRKRQALLDVLAGRV